MFSSVFLTASTHSLLLHSVLMITTILIGPDLNTIDQITTGSLTSDWMISNSQHPYQKWLVYNFDCILHLILLQFQTLKLFSSQKNTNTLSSIFCSRLQQYFMPQSRASTNIFRKSIYTYFKESSRNSKKGK